MKSLLERITVDVSSILEVHPTRRVTLYAHHFLFLVNTTAH
jgi:hypothetical protein